MKTEPRHLATASLMPLKSADFKKEKDSQKVALAEALEKREQLERDVKANHEFINKLRGAVELLGILEQNATAEEVEEVKKAPTVDGDSATSQFAGPDGKPLQGTVVPAVAAAVGSSNTSGNVPIPPGGLVSETARQVVDAQAHNIATLDPVHEEDGSPIEDPFTGETLTWEASHEEQMQQPSRKNRSGGGGGR
jgi:hypothetical protein